MLRAMYCPECHAEYRPGFTHCADCDIDLVEWLPEETARSEEDLTVLWECSDQTECSEVCGDLQKANIEYRVEQIPAEKGPRMRVEWRYRVLILPGDLERAKTIFDIEGPQNTVASSDDDGEEAVDPSLELPDTSAGVSDEPKRRDTYLNPWYPDDATVEVWAQTEEDRSSTIKLSLDANRIHCRCDSDEVDGKKIFVRPEDESFAREIVREIIEGTPLR